jgi:pyridoxamine 5'-phosphate oxidase family protein
MFSEEEDAYIRSQRLGRLATVSPDGQPDADAVGFQWNGEAIVFGGLQLLKTRKAKNIAAGNTRVSFVIDDLDPTGGGWKPRGIKIHGIAEISTDGERPLISIKPVTTWSWGIQDVAHDGTKPRFHKTEWAQ